MPKISFIPVIAQIPLMDFNRSAKTEQEAALIGVGFIHLYKRA
ncbi:hypothetical protein [Campylobacter fetus]|nr:hypothetical protein [Campylobacter fetus]